MWNIYFLKLIFGYKFVIKFWYNVGNFMKIFHIWEKNIREIVTNEHYLRLINYSCDVLCISTENDV